MGDNSRSSVPKPIFHFQRPRGGAGPRLQMEPQTSIAADSVPDISTSSTLQSLGITSEQVAAIAKIVMAVQDQNPPKPDIPLKRNAMNTSGTIREQNDRREKSPRRRVLVVRAFPFRHRTT